MKKAITYIIFMLLIGSSNGIAQTWASCGKFYHDPKALYNDTISKKLYVAGFDYLTTNSFVTTAVAAWDGNQWDTLGSGMLGVYDEFLIRYNNKLFVQRGLWVDTFTSITRIFTWDFNTKKWDSLPQGLVNGTIKTAIPYNGDLIIVGVFNKIGSTTVHNIARYDGINFYPVGFPSFSVYIRTVEIYNNEIYIGGNFSGDTIRNAIAKWNGSQWVDVGGGFSQIGQPEVVKLKTYHNRLYAAGTFYGTKSNYMPSIGAWDGTKWNDIGGIRYNSFPWGVVYNMFELNNKLHVTGTFEQAGNVAVNNMAVWNDTNWCSVNATFQTQVWVTTPFQNKIYVAGNEIINGDTVHLLGYNTYTNYIGNCGTLISINEIDISNTIKIYPNPTTSLINIVDEQNELQNTTIELRNPLGQTILSIPFSNQIDISNLSSGMYYLTIQDGSHKKIVKVVKE